MMPAPDAGTTASPSIAASAASPSSLSNAAAQNGAPAAPTDAPASDDTMQQNKEKAKAMMHASLSANSSAPSRNLSKSPAINTSDRHASNSPSVAGRKRSRSESRVPNAPADGKWPDTTRLLIQQFTSRDQAHSAAMQRNRTRQDQVAAEMAEDKDLLERFRARRIQEAQTNPTRVTYPAHRRSLWGRRTPCLRVSGKDRARQAETLEDLVPVRLDLEFEKLRLRDTFTWNLHDRTVNPRLFAQNLVEDFHLPPEAADYFMREVYNSISEQITDFHPHVNLEEDPLDPHLPYSAYKNDDMRVQIKLNITIGPHTLVDQFEWDINNPQNSPEDFAQQMANDLSLSGEFMTAIAHCIREQSQLFTKSLFLTRHAFDGRPIEDSDIRENLLPSPIHTAYRPFQAAKEHAPYFYELNEADVERTELAFSREQRQQKRSTNRRGGPSLPDLKDRLKTWRTMVVSSVIPGSADGVDKSGIYRMSRSRRKPWNAGRGGDDDEDVSGESEDDSEPESPVRPQPAYGGTSRTRGMRGAAAAANVSMRVANRSPSPEIQQPQETKKMSRRVGASPIFEEWDEQGNRTGLTVKVKVPRERFRQWWRDWKSNLPAREEAQRKAAALAAQQAAREQADRIASMRNTPSAMGPPTTPGMANRNLPGGAGISRPSSSGPAAPTPPPGSGPAASPTPGVPASPAAGVSVPAPPVWLQNNIAALRQKWPEDRFEGLMRRNKDANGPAFVPRIKCSDCPGNVYLVDEKDPGLTNFEQHLKLLKHVEKRNERVKAEAGH